MTDLSILVDLFVIAVAGNGVVELWHHGSIFAIPRAGARPAAMEVELNIDGRVHRPVLAFI